jgi:hypothetical protein
MRDAVQAIAPVEAVEDRMTNDSLPFEKVSVEEAKKALEVGVAPLKVEERDWRWARKWTPPETLRDSTAKWLLKFAPEYRPIDLPHAYPRIANRLCELWQDPESCERYFAELLNDRRGKRQGFPDGVLADLKMLHQLYAKAHSASGPWDVEATRRR